ncbi:unnamed protein product, partial [Symbiodinium sp. CCMP2456]
FPPEEGKLAASSSLRAEAPEFVPALQPVFVMVPLAMFEAMLMQAASSGMQLMMMPMNMDMTPTEFTADWTTADEAGTTACFPDVDKAEKEQEPTEQPSGCESDDDCDSIFWEPLAFKRQMTIWVTWFAIPKSGVSPFRHRLL